MAKSQQNALINKFIDTLENGNIESKVEPSDINFYSH